jgi:hypothetical protein
VTRPFLLGTLLLLAACGGEEAELGPRELPLGIPEPGSLLRLPAGGGAAQLYAADSLAPLEWRIASGVPATTRFLTFDDDDQMAYAVDDAGTLIGVDLLSRRARPYLRKTVTLTGTSDGTVLGLDSARRALRFSDRTLTTFRSAPNTARDVTLLRAPSGRVSIYARDEGSLQVLSEEGELRRITAPAGAVSSTWFGDLVAITNDSGVTLLRPGQDEPYAFIRLGGSPIVAVFSPSAHQIYVSRGRGDVVILDRFTRNEVARVELPGAARALRPDRTGKWLLAQAETGDSLWLVDMVAHRRISTIAAPWGPDLPVVAGGRTLVVREGRDVVSYDLTRPEPEPRARLSGAADDLYALVPWAPRPSRAPGPILALDTTASADSGGVTADSLTEDAPAEGNIFIQVSSSQNEGYARALARQLAEIGFRTRVREPQVDGDGFKVLVGPYPNRDEAEADGRRLGRPYFVTTPGITPP